LIECPHFIGVGLYVNYILTKAWPQDTELINGSY
jgi:hypothetical protein